MQALGGELILGTPMDTIRYDDGAVRGVRASGPGRTIDIEAGAVVLATGGFQGNPELLSRYVTPYADKVYLRANPWSTGDGFMAATRIGAAATVGMQAFYGHALPAPPTHFTATEFLDVSQRYGPLGVAINLDGRRFIDESAGTRDVHLNQAIAMQREATAVYIVDAEIADMSYFGYMKPAIAIQRVRERNGPVIERDTLEELCTALADWGITGVKALETLREYTVALTNGTADQLDPPRRKHRFPLATPPFTAVAVRPGITFTCGGLAVDTDMRVLRRSASCSTLPLVFAEPAEANLCPVPNVYAAGCDVGNISDLDYIGGLATALTTGRIAGRAAALCALSGDHTSTAYRSK
jgi:succinate dehydrogenase/fumarate reductase flavoprotein subunit